MNKNQYVNTLPQEVQDEIWKFLCDLDTDELTNHDINNAMNAWPRHYNIYEYGRIKRTN